MAVGDTFTGTFSFQESAGIVEDGVVTASNSVPWGLDRIDQSSLPLVSGCAFCHRCKKPAIKFQIQHPNHTLLHHRTALHGRQIRTAVGSPCTCWTQGLIRLTTSLQATNGPSTTCGTRITMTFQKTTTATATALTAPGR